MKLLFASSCGRSDHRYAYTGWHVRRKSLIKIGYCSTSAPGSPLLQLRTRANGPGPEVGRDPYRHLVPCIDIIGSRHGTSRHPLDRPSTGRTQRQQKSQRLAGHSGAHQPRQSRDPLQGVGRATETRCDGHRVIRGANRTKGFTVKTQEHAFPKRADESFKDTTLQAGTAFPRHQR